jgi:hypothetical protein
VRLCLLPETPMVPRLWDRRVGYFTTDVEIGGPRQLTVGAFGAVNLVVEVDPRIWGTAEIELFWFLALLVFGRICAANPGI